MASHKFRVVFFVFAIGIFTGSDIKGNCYDFRDFAYFANDFKKTEPNLVGDINGDGTADYNDLMILTESWSCRNDFAYSLEPYVMPFDEHTEKMRMKTVTPATIEVKYGRDLGYRNSIVDGNTNYVHELSMENLTPGTLYYYNVIASYGDQITNFKSSFAASDNSKTRFRFGIFGDSRGDNCGEVGSGVASGEAYQRMLGNMADSGVEFVIINGDDVQCYYCPQTVETYDNAWKNFHIASAALREANPGIPYLSSLGNHELTYGGFSAVGLKAFQDYWMHPQNGGGLPGNWSETTFTWRYGNSLFIFLNSEEQGYEGRMSDEQLCWFAESLQQADFTHKFVISHRALVGSVRNDSWGAMQYRDPCTSAIIDNLMYDSNVTAGFYSHEHYFNYITTQDGNMMHFITGGAGAPKRYCSYIPNPGLFGDITNCCSIYESDKCSTSYDSNNCSVIYESDNCIPTQTMWHYIVVDVNDKAMEANVYDDNGNLQRSYRKEFD